MDYHAQGKGPSNPQPCGGGRGGRRSVGPGETGRTSITNKRSSVGRSIKGSGVSVKWLTQAVVEAVARRMLSASEARGLLRDLVRSGLRVRSEVLAEVVHLIDGAGRAAK